MVTYTSMSPEASLTLSNFSYQVGENPAEQKHKPKFQDLETSLLTLPPSKIVSDGVLGETIFFISS